MSRDEHRVVARVVADADPSALLAQAASVGRLRSFIFEPPQLDDVFRDLVSR